MEEPEKLIEGPLGEAGVLHDLTLLLPVWNLAIIS